VLVVLNTATEADLTKLPGVGPKKARAILSLREKLGGRFKRIEDLMRVRGLKRKALEKIRPLVVLDAEDEAKKGAPR
jgi:competence protein ComEA